MRPLEEVATYDLGEKEMRLTLSVFINSLCLHQILKKDIPPIHSALDSPQSQQ
jgi:hypothetical protein